MTAAKYFVIVVYGYKNCAPIDLTPKTIAEARQSIAWQKVGGCDTQLHICTAHPEERGTFANVETGNLFPANRGAWTEDAWNAFLDRTWTEASGK
jgi:hypothetical protein